MVLIIINLSSFMGLRHLIISLDLLYLVLSHLLHPPSNITGWILCFRSLLSHFIRVINFINVFLYNGQFMN